MRDLPRLVRAAADGRISRRRFCSQAMLLGLSASATGSVLAACGGESASQTATSSTTKPERIHLYTWSEYLAPAVRQGFEDETGIEVVETYYDDNEALLSKLKGGATGYDLVVPSDYMVHVMVMSNLVEALDMSLLPNFKYVLPRFQHPAFDPETDGRKYSVPWSWGTTGIGLRADMATGHVSRWADLWDQRNGGQLTMLNDERETLGAALKMLGFSLNTTSSDELDQAVELLVRQKPLVRAYDSINMKRSLIDGVPYVHTWNGEALLAMDAVGADKVRYVLPKEGFTVWVDSLCIPKDAPSPYGAHLFIDYVCRPEVAAKLVDYIGYLSPNVEAVKNVGSPIVRKNTPSDRELEDGEMINDVGDLARLYTDAWARVKSA